MDGIYGFVVSAADRCAFNWFLLLAAGGGNTKHSAGSRSDQHYPLNSIRNVQLVQLSEGVSELIPGQHILHQ